MQRFGNAWGCWAMPFDIAGEWPAHELRTLIRKVRSGATPRGGAETYLAERVNYALVRSQNVFDHRFEVSGLAYVSDAQARDLAGAELEADDVLLNITGDGVTFGRSCLVPATVLPACVNQHVMLIRVDSAKCSAGYLASWLALPETKGYVESFNAGGSRRAITKGHIEAFRVPVPPLDVQREIADFAGAMNHRIHLFRQTCATLESIAQALFKSWFIDFDPVRAKAEGREPEGMDAATAALFPAEFEESALGVMPKGWRVAAIRDVVADVYDGPHATPPEASEGPVFLGIKNLTGTSLDLGEVRHISEGDWAQWTRRVTPQPDDIVFSYEAALGLFALIPPGLTCCLGRRLALVRPRAEDGTPHFWFHQFIGEPFQRLLDKHTVHGATVNRIALKEFPSFTVMDPGNRLRIAFESVAQPLWARIHANRQQALNLAETRDTLLPRLISGKVRLPEAGDQLEEALA